MPNKTAVCGGGGSSSSIKQCGARARDGGSLAGANALCDAFALWMTMF
jgi:hypothetical protein